MATLTDAKEIAATIAKTTQPVSIIAFGSVAKNGTGNDIDLLFVYEDKSNALESIRRDVNKNLKSFYTKFAVDPFVVALSSLRTEFFKGSPFLRLIQREGRVLYMKDSIKQWIKQCKEDLESAKYLLQGKYYRGACYNSQQAIEKYLKAMLLRKGWELEKIHNIERLIALSEDYGIQLNFNEDDIVFIDSIYRGRYPGEEGILPLKEPGKRDAERSVLVADNLLRNCP